MSRIDGSDVAEFLDGTSARDFIFAKGGDDDIQGRTGGDFVFAGDGEDTSIYSDLARAVIADLEHGFARSGSDTDLLFSVEDVTGSNFGDRLHGNSGANHLEGGDGDDRIWGGAGDDILNGGNGHDCIVGESGNDLIDGGSGNDLIDLGNFSGESDTIVFSYFGGSDTIENFDAASDQLKLDGLSEDILTVQDTADGTLVQSFTGQSVLLADVHGIALADLTFV